MSIHPIEYRYGSDEMRAIFRAENWLSLMLRVEAALAKAEAKVGLVPIEASEAIEEAVKGGGVGLKRVRELEGLTKHETMAVVLALAEASEPHGGYVHLGATSNDILDTTLALQLDEAIVLTGSKLIKLTKAMIRLGRENLDRICLGRTHGLAALPMPFGFKCAVWSSTMKSNMERLLEARRRAVRGKISGAVGTMASFRGKGREIQQLVMKELGIQAAEISTQVVPRDSLAELMLVLALISTSLDLIANEIRNLQRTEIGEVQEPFEVRHQVGSSSMPHKRNPIRSEKVCGLARVLRGIAVSSLENVVLEHERDLTNSSVERTIVPEAFLLLEEQIMSLTKVMDGLIIRPDAMKRNIEATSGLIMAERVVMELVQRGIGRQEAHELIRGLAMKAIDEKRPFEEILLAEPRVTGLLSADEIGELMDSSTYIGEGPVLAQKIFEETEKYLESLKLG